MAGELKRTPLHEEHRRLDGKIVPFAGFEMPVQYPSGILKEHRAVRRAAGLFDVSHMGEFDVRGPGALELVQRVTVNDASRLQVGQAQYSALCREDGGILDDLLVYRLEDRYMLVVNASNRDKDWRWISRHAAGLDAGLEDRSDEIALLALQGSASREILTPLTGVELDGVGYYRCVEGQVAGVPGVVARTGYTGEDGFELYVPAAAAAGLWRRILRQGGKSGLLPAGLGARDSLRLEMGYALYGNDLDEAHTPLEAGLGWIAKLGKEEFVGREALLRQRERGVQVRLAGLRLTERGFPRAGYAITAKGGGEVGRVTSGGVGPSTGFGAAMGYIPAALAVRGTPLEIVVRGRPLAAEVHPPPFYTEGSIKR